MSRLLCILLLLFLRVFLWVRILAVRITLPISRRICARVVGIPFAVIFLKLFHLALELLLLLRAHGAGQKGRYQIIYELLHSFNQMTAELGSTEMMRYDFINTFSHEFKTPIVSIRGFAKRLRNENLSPEKQKKYLEYIAEESERLSDLASSVLLIARYENQKLVTEQAEYDLDEQIRGCVLRMEALWSAKGLTFEMDLPKLPYTNNVEMMEHVWMNLISNAIKFSHEGGRIFISSLRKTDSIAITIRDEGIGISPSEIGHIFDKFYQADTAHSSVGNGLGLPLVYRIVQLSGGSIHVKSEVGKGTEFTVTLPVSHT